VKDDQVPIVLGAHLHFGSVAWQKTAIAADPELDRRVIVRRGRRLGGSGAGEQQGKEQRGDHSTSQTTFGYTSEITMGHADT
jgi:hypothetical protein